MRNQWEMNEKQLGNKWELMTMDENIYKINGNSNNKLKKIMENEWKYKGKWTIKENK